MVLIAAAIAATAPSPVAPTATATARVAVQATATVRILSGVRLKLDSPTNADAPAAHDSMVMMKDGTAQPARLIEFQ